MNILLNICVIGVGATIGASMRYYLGVMMTHLLGKGWLYGTLSANILGSFLAGIFVVLFLEKTIIFNDTYKLMLLTGLAGSLTTMSALSVDSIQMLGAGNYKQAMLNILFNVIFSLFFVWIGLVLARYLFVIK